MLRQRTCEVVDKMLSNVHRRVDEACRLVCMLLCLRLLRYGGLCGRDSDIGILSEKLIQAQILGKIATLINIHPIIPDEVQHFER